MGKGKKIALLVSMVLVLAVAAVLNVTLLGQKESQSDGDATTVGNFFTVSRNNRMTTRNYEIEQLNEIINMEGEEYAEARQNALAQKQKLIEAIDTELLLETILKAQGFEDVLVTVSTGGESVNVIVDKDELTRTDRARIYNAIKEEIDIAPDYVKFISI